jgi:hypothetical protein
VDSIRAIVRRFPEYFISGSFRSRGREQVKQQFATKGRVDTLWRWFAYETGKSGEKLDGFKGRCRAVIEMLDEETRYLILDNLVCANKGYADVMAAGVRFY